MKSASATLIVALLSLAGCSADRAGAPTATQGSPAGVGDGSASSPTPAPSRTEQDKIVDAYDQFWRRIHEASGKPEASWRPSLSEVATDPQLSTTLQGLGLLRQQSLTLYGLETAHIGTVKVDGDRATVIDCQDGSTAGQAEAQTGTRKTVGVPRNPVKATVLRGTDGRWRVSDINYPGGAC
jgi:hypothetical protein